MEPKPQQAQHKKPEPAVVPVHKLAHNFRVRLLINGQLQMDGELDLTNSINGQGVVRNAPHNHAPPERLSGQANPITLPNGQQSFEITLQTADGSATYRGVLLHDAGNELAIGGFFKFNRSVRRNLELPAAPGQDEGVWIITKP